MFRHISSLSAAGLVCQVMLSAIARAQAPVAVSLGSPIMELSEPMMTVNGVRELSDESVLIVDSRRNIIFAANRKTGTVRGVGILGEGPGQYCHPIRLISLPGDSTLVFDAARARLALFAPASPNGVPFFLREFKSPLGQSLIEHFETAGSDAAGHLYVPGATYTRSSSGQTIILDSVAIERVDRKVAKVDTVANLPPVGMPGPESTSRSVPPLEPLASADQWAVSLDGRVAIVHLNPYRVEIVDANGRRVVGTPIAMTPISFGTAARQQWMADEWPYFGDGGVAHANRINGSIVPGRCGELGSTAGREITFPTELPPFPPNAVRFAPDGFLWVQRSALPGDREIFDVIDSEAKVVARVTMPPDTILVGFGSSSLYAVRIDEKHAEFLRQYPMPVIPRAK